MLTISIDHVRSVEVFVLKRYTIIFFVVELGYGPGKLDLTFK